MRWIGVGLLAVCCAVSAAAADPGFTDSNVNTASYTQSGIYTSAGSTMSVANTGSGLSVTLNAAGTSTNIGFGNVAFIKNGFSYTPAAQGPLSSLTFTATTSYSSSIPVVAGTPWSTGCGAVIEQDGNYYVAFLTGPAYYSGSSGFFTCSQSGMTASSFQQLNLPTGLFAAGTPNFGGDPMTFGILIGLGAYETTVLGQVVSSLGYDLVPAQSPPVLAASPGVLNFSAPAGSSGSLQQTISIANSGGSSAPVSASSVSGSPWISMSPSSGSVSPGSATLFNVTINPQGLSPGNYRDVIQFTSTAPTVMVPVTLLVTNTGPILFAGPGGFLFSMAQGAGSSVVQTLAIANQGSAGSSLSWSLSPSTGPGVPNGNFLKFGITAGQLQAGSAISVPVSLNPNASSLAPGVYYELIQVSAAGGTQNSPQYATAVLNVLAPSAVLQAQLSPAGLVFTGQAGSAVLPQQFTVNWSSTFPAGDCSRGVHLESEELACRVTLKPGRVFQRSGLV